MKKLNAKVNNTEGGMDNSTFNRRAVMKVMLTGAAAPWIMRSNAFASSCGDQIVRLAGNLSPDTLNPFATWNSWWPLAFTYDFLVAVDAQRHSDRKGFAKEWSVAEDNRTWTFKIWPGMKWSDGQPATARDAAFTLNYLRNSMGKPDELNIGQNTTADLGLVESIEALDDETLQIVTQSPTRWPIDNYMYIVPQHIWKDVRYADARGPFQNNAPLVGTGPMIVSEFQQGQFARFTPNPYFRTGKPATKGMVFRFFDTVDPIAQGLKSGELDYGMYITPVQWDDLSKDANIAVGEQRVEQRNFLAFNTLSGKGEGSTKALQDQAFRDAIGYAIDQKTIVDRVMHGHADPGVGLIVPAVADYYSDLTDIRRHFDLEEAGRRLDMAGYRDTDGDGIREDKEGKKFQLELITGSSPGTLDTAIAGAQLIVAWLGQIGIPVSVTQLDRAALVSRYAAPASGGGGWDLLFGNSWKSPAPRAMLNMGRSTQIGVENVAFWSNEKFDQLFSEIDNTVDLEKSQELVNQAVRLIYSEAPYIVLCYPFVLDAHRKDCFEGWGTQDIMSMWGYFPFDRLKPV